MPLYFVVAVVVVFLIKNQNLHSCNLVVPFFNPNKELGYHKMKLNGDVLQYMFFIIYWALWFIFIFKYLSMKMSVPYLI